MFACMCVLGEKLVAVTFSGANRDVLGDGRGEEVDDGVVKGCGEEERRG